MGYASLDFRVNDKNEIFFLEINFTCSVFYTDGYEGSADFVLKFDEAGQKGFLEHIIAEGIARDRRKKKPYAMKGNSIAGFGIYATRNIRKGDIVFCGRGKSPASCHQGDLSKKIGLKNKNLISAGMHMPSAKKSLCLWDEDPSEWAPQNHSCDANTGLDGLNVVALRKYFKKRRTDTGLFPVPG